MRLFAGIPSPEEVTRAAAAFQDELRGGIPGVRWVAPDAIHCTFAFIGECGEDRLETVNTALSRAASSVRSAETVVRGFGAFPVSGDPRVLWVGLEDARGALARCARAVREQLTAAGIMFDDKPFAAHLTIGRVKTLLPAARVACRQALAAHAQRSFGILPVTSVSLVESVLTPGGPQYTVLKEHHCA